MNRSGKVFFRFINRHDDTEKRGFHTIASLLTSLHPPRQEIYRQTNSIYYNIKSKICHPHFFTADFAAVSVPLFWPIYPRPYAAGSAMRRASAQNPTFIFSCLRRWRAERRPRGEDDTYHTVEYDYFLRLTYKSLEYRALGKLRFIWNRCLA